MKYIVLMAVLVSIFYVTATQLVLGQLNSLASFYEHADTIAQNSLDK